MHHAFKTDALSFRTKRKDSFGAKAICLCLAFTLACNNSRSELSGSKSIRDLGSFSPQQLAEQHKKVKLDPKSQWVTNAWRKMTWTNFEKMYASQHLDSGKVTVSIGGVKISNRNVFDSQYKAGFAAIKASGSPASIMTALHLKRDSFTPGLIEKAAKVVKDAQLMSKSDLEKLPSKELMKIQKATAVLFDAGGIIAIQAKKSKAKSALSLAGTDTNDTQAKSQNDLANILPFVGLMGLQLATLLAVTTGAQKSRGELATGSSGRIIGTKAATYKSRNSGGSKNSNSGSANNGDNKNSGNGDNKDDDNEGDSDGKTDDDWDEDWKDETKEDSGSNESGQGTDGASNDGNADQGANSSTPDATNVAQNDSWNGADTDMAAPAGDGSSGDDFGGGDFGGGDFGGGDFGGGDFGGGDFGGGDFGGGDFGGFDFGGGDFGGGE